MTTDNERFLAANRALWDEWTGIHETSEFYDLDGFRRGGVRLRDFEVEDVGSVEGKTLLHLQCHFGIDTLSWSRLGAHVTGADFSPKAVELASRLASELNLDARFVCSNVYDLPENLEGEFDVVYTSRGVLGWLPDIQGWARVVAHFVKPDGLFYIHEVHPVAQVWADENVGPGELKLHYPYFTNEAPFEFDTEGSYADRDAEVASPKEYGWNHSMAEIVTALASAGLHIELLREFPYTEWEYAFLEKRVPDGGSDLEASWWLPGDSGGELPLFFALRASKPAGS